MNRFNDVRDLQINMDKKLIKNIYITRQLCTVKSLIKESKQMQYPQLNLYTPNSTISQIIEK